MGEKMDKDTYLKWVSLFSGPKAPSLMDEVNEKREDIIEKAKTSVALNDAYGNSLTATGNDDRVKSFTNYGFSNDSLNWPLWLALYNDSWVFRRAIDKPSVDMVRCGITLSGEEDKANIYRELKKQRFQLIQLCQWGALFGGSVAVVMFDNLKDEDYAKPIEIAKIKHAKTITLYVTDRWYGIAPSTTLVDDMNSIDYGKPKSYDITFADGHLVTVHHDYILRYEHRTAPRLIKNGQLQGWGYAEGAHIINELSRDDQLKSSITSLVNKALIEVIKMSGMRGVFMGQDEGSQKQLEARLEMVNWARTYNSLTFLDKEDEYQEHGFSGLNGLADLLEQNMWLISAALEMQGVLFGDLKQGFSNDTDALERYDETILNRAESYFRPVLEKFLLILYKKYGIQDKIEFDFNSLLVKKHDEEKMEGLKKYQEFLSALLQDGVIDTQEYAKSIQTFINKNQVDLGLTDEKINALKDKFEEEMESIDLNADVDEDEEEL